MNLTDHAAIKFDRILPIYNWLYPSAGFVSERFQGTQAVDVFGEFVPGRGRALYFHIPFCETICTFCPFVRTRYRDSSVIDAYVTALLQEIDIKSRFPQITDVPIRAIYFGGGTPSLLAPDHIRRIGSAIRRTFDMRRLKEFSFEFEVKSVTPERIAALVDIGVTHARFGLQTLSAEYRRRFELTATVEQLYFAANSLLAAFPYVSCDVLYGMNGQTVDDLIADIEGVCSLGLRNIDFYPINNVVTQPKLHRTFQVEGKEPVSGLTKYYMSLLIRKAMHAKGYLPHNGHGYVRVPDTELTVNQAVTNLYSFVYHEHVYGYSFYDVLGFGTNAISSFRGYTTQNTSSRSEYVKALGYNHLPVLVKEHSKTIDACRPVCLRLPYHGITTKRFVDWANIPEDTLERLSRLTQAGLIHESDNAFELTRQGWEWYSCIMYYLMPREERLELDTLVSRGERNPHKRIEPTGLEDVIWPRSAIGRSATT
jgi:oxygen-independent coproporphyrinogen-3 oxidase